MVAQYENYLREMLLPLGVYDLSGTGVSGSELSALGAGLDEVAEHLEYVEREALTPTAEGEGLSRRENLFARKPAAPSTELRRAAIASLLQIDGDSLTLDAINRTISGCGIPAQVQETKTVGQLRVIFPETAGEPDQYAQIQKIILDLLPCHLETEFYLRYMTWAECEEKKYTWDTAEEAGHTWQSFQLAV